MWWLVKKAWLFLSACRTPGEKEKGKKKEGSMCPRATKCTPHPVLYTTWETLPQDFQGWV